MPLPVAIVVVFALARLVTLAVLRNRSSGITAEIASFLNLMILLLGKRF